MSSARTIKAALLLLHDLQATGIANLRLQATTAPDRYGPYGPAAIFIDVLSLQRVIGILARILEHADVPLPAPHQPATRRPADD